MSNWELSEAGVEWEFCPTWGPGCVKVVLRDVEAYCGGGGHGYHWMVPTTRFEASQEAAGAPSSSEVDSGSTDDANGPQICWVCEQEKVDGDLLVREGDEWIHYRCRMVPADPVNSPLHYTQYPVEVIEITEKLNFLMGNVIKYVLRADYKGKPLEDLKKARWYLEREIANRESAGSS